MSAAVHDVTAWVHPLPTVIPAYDVVRESVTKYENNFSTPALNYPAYSNTNGWETTANPAITSPSGCRYSRSTHAFPHSGTYAGVLTNNLSGTDSGVSGLKVFTYGMFGFVVGRPYTVSVWIAGRNIGAGQTFALGVAGIGASAPVAVPTITTAADWVQVSYTFTPTTANLTIEFRVTFPSTGFTQMQLDDFTLSSDAWIDYDTPNLPGWSTTYAAGGTGATGSRIYVTGIGVPANGARVETIGGTVAATPTVTASRTFTGLTIGRSYSFTADVSSRDPARRVRMGVGGVWTSYVTTPDPATFSTLSFTFTATATSATLNIEGSNLSGVNATAVFNLDNVFLDQDVWTETIPQVIIPATPFQLDVLNGSTSLKDDRYPYVLSELICTTPTDPTQLEQTDPYRPGVRLTVAQEVTELGRRFGDVLEAEYTDPDLEVSPGYTDPPTPVPAYYSTDVVEAFEGASIFSNPYFTTVAGAGRNGTDGYVHDGSAMHHTTYTGSLGPGPDTTFSVWVRATNPVPSLGGVAFGMTGTANAGYQVLLDTRRGSASTGAFQLRRDGLSSTLAWSTLTGTNPVADAWYRVEVDWRSSGTTITARAYNEAGDLLGTITSSDTTYTAPGGYGVYAFGTVALDNFTARSGYVAASTLPGLYHPPVVLPGEFHPARYGTRAEFDLVLIARTFDKQAGTMRIVAGSRESRLEDYKHPVLTSERIYGLSVRPAVQFALAKKSYVLEAGGADGNVLTDDIPAPVTNLFRNPSMESALDIAASGATVQRVTTWARTGTYSTSLTAPTSTDSYFTMGGDSAAIRNGMQAGKKYTVSGFIRLSAPLTGTVGTRARSIVVFTKVGAAAYVEARSTIAPNVAGVHRVSCTFSVPENVGEAFIRFYHGQTAGSVWWDDIQLVEGDEPLEPFNGSTPATGEASYAWTGTAHQSTSVKAYLPNADVFVWEPGVSAWDYLAPILSSTGLRLYSDEQGKFRLVTRDALVDGQQNISPENGVTEAVEDRDRKFGSYYDHVILKYADGVIDMARVSGGTDDLGLFRDYSDRTIPIFGGAQAVLARALGAGRKFDVSQASNYNAKPGQQVVITLPDELPVVGIIRAVTWSHPDGVMTIETRQIIEAPETSWLFADLGKKWQDVPVGIDWTEYTA